MQKYKVDKTTIFKRLSFKMRLVSPCEKLAAERQVEKYINSLQNKVSFNLSMPLKKFVRARR